MENQIENTKIIITADRNSICAGDDIYSHQNNFEFDGKVSIEQAIKRLNIILNIQIMEGQLGQGIIKYINA